MPKTLTILFVVLMAGLSASALDQFDGIRCGADIPKALLGKHDSNQRVAVLEERHKDIGLKNLGGTEISDSLFLASWQVCGSEYELLIKNKTGLIRDVLAFPAHSAPTPMFIGTCQQDGKAFPETFVAMLNNSNGYDPRDTKIGKTMLKTRVAWKIDPAREKFASQATRGLECPLDGVVTQDGGS